MLYSASGRSRMIGLAARVLWRLPGRFQIAGGMGPSYGLRSVVFHDIAREESPFTRGLNVTVTPEDFEAALQFITRYYHPVSLRDVLAGSGAPLPPRALLVTFDDGYRSIADWAAPLCLRYGVPAVLFLNASLLDNAGLAADNLVCYVANVFGLGLIDRVAQAMESGLARVSSLDDVYWRVFPALSPGRRQRFLEMLAAAVGIDQRRLAAEAGLYLAGENVRELSAAGFEIGSHTYSHVHCRTLAGPEFGEEIGRNREKLERLTARPVRSFSVPYGSSLDLTSEVAAYLRGTGHDAVFLSESVANRAGAGPKWAALDRISIHANRAGALFCEIEVLPRLRALRNRYAREPRAADVRPPLASAAETN